MTPSRRALLTGAAALSAAPALAASPAADPRKSAEGQVKVQGDLDTRNPAPWWYEIAVYAMREGKAPQLILRGEGCETYFFRRQPDGVYEMRAITVTGFQDPLTSAWIDAYDNPFTGKRNTVRPNILSGGSTFFPADGGPPEARVSDVKPSEINPAGGSAAVGSAGATGPLRWLRWIEQDDKVCLFSQRLTDAPFQPLMETSSTWVDRKAFFDPRATRLEANFASSFVCPWLGWMEMKGEPGHLMWHSSGRKLKSLANLPTGYRARAEQIAPGRLEQDPFAGA